MRPTAACGRCRWPASQTSENDRLSRSLRPTVQCGQQTEIRRRSQGGHGSADIRGHNAPPHPLLLVIAGFSRCPLSFPLFQVFTFAPFPSLLSLALSIFYPAPQTHPTSTRAGRWIWQCHSSGRAPTIGPHRRQRPRLYSGQPYLLVRTYPPIPRPALACLPLSTATQRRAVSQPPPGGPIRAR